VVSLVVIFVLELLKIEKYVDTFLLGTDGYTWDEGCP
jgi:hypothetical protein